MLTASTNSVDVAGDRSVSAILADLARPQLSIFVQTKDEERNIASCLKCLAFSDDVVVLDSYSTDRTVEIARSFKNVRVIQRQFDTSPRHHNWALENIQFKHPWVYLCDADEHVTPELRDEMLRTISRDTGNVVAFRLRYKNMFMGRWLEHGGIYPVWIMRLFRPEKVRYEDRRINCHPIVNGEVGELREHFIHYSFNKGLVPWFNKHNVYSQLEAREAVVVREAPVGEYIQAAFSEDRAVRRRAQKNLSFFLPMRGLARFFYMALFNRGFLDGWPGIQYAMMISMYEYWISAKVIEQSSPWAQNTDEVISRFLSTGGLSIKTRPAPAEPEHCVVDIIIPTLNDGDQIAAAVAQARALGRVFVLDGGSTDSTVENAAASGATVVTHAAAQAVDRITWALQKLPFKSQWVLILNPDEWITPELRREIRSVLANKPSADAFSVKQLSLFMGRQIRHSGYYPARKTRLFRRGTARYQPQLPWDPFTCTGRTLPLNNGLLHVRWRGITEFLEEHIIYSQLKAKELYELKIGVQTAPRKGAAWWSRLWMHLPGKPALRFIHTYFLRGGFLDGRAGYHLCRMISCQEYMTSLLCSDLLAQHRHNPAPVSIEMQYDSVAG